MTDFEYREAKVQDWLNELETKYSKDYSTKLEEKLKKIKDIKDLENIDIDIDISEDLINFHILGKYLAVMELKTDFKKEFAKNDDVFSMPFKKAVEEMKKRKPILFKDLETTEKQEKENHFWIKKTTNLNITKDIYTKLIKSLEQGNTSDTFIKDVVSDYKLPKGYLEGVYRTVTTQAQQRGHLEQQLNMIDLGYKYGMFTSVLDGRETHKCHDMNGKILPIKEFIEKGLYPPLHYRCRSSIIQLDDDDLKEMNLKVTENIEKNPNRFSDYRKNEIYLELFNKKKEEVEALKEIIKEEKIEKPINEEIFDLIEIEKGEEIKIEIENTTNIYDKDGGIIKTIKEPNYKHITNEGAIKLAEMYEDWIGSEDFVRTPFGYIATPNYNSINGYLRGLGTKMELFASEEHYSNSMKTISIIDTLIENGIVKGGQTLHRYTTANVLQNVLGVENEMLSDIESLRKLNSKIDLAEFLKGQLVEREFSDKGYTSASYNKQINYFQLENGYDFHWEISIPNDIKGFLTNNRSVESEVVLGRNTKFRIKDVVVDNPTGRYFEDYYKITIKVEVVDE